MNNKYSLVDYTDYLNITLKCYKNSVKQNFKKFCYTNDIIYSDIESTTTINFENPYYGKVSSRLRVYE